MSDFVKNDSGKLQWSLMPFEQLEDTVRVLMKGAEKYSRDNWKKCDDVNRYKDALMRHVTAYIKGEERDPEDNLPHLAHAICNCLFLQYFDNDVIYSCEEAMSFISVPDKNGEFCKVGTQVKVLPKGEENYLLGVILWDKKGFFISTFRKDYRLNEVVWFERVKTVDEQVEEYNEQKAVRCPSKEDD